MKVLFSIIVACGLFAAWGCGRQSSRRADIAPERPHQPVKVMAEHLPNAFQIHPKVISGGLPEGDVAFAELAALGVKTVISVDGATPDVATAKKHGMRYVHLPHGYDGIPASRAKELAKAVRDLPGPIYIHCHHGKHRSPAAAAVACVVAGLIDYANAEQVLRAAGTSENYRGLYQSALGSRRLDGRALDRLVAEFPETAAIPPLAEAMVAVEHTHDHLKQMAAANWQAPTDHPDLEPAHEALLLREHFKELLRLESVLSQPAEFQHYLVESEAAAEQLEAGLRDEDGRDNVAKAFAAISKACVDCHQQFRDVPLGEKR